MKIGERLCRNGVLILLQAVMSLAHNGLIDRVQWRPLTWPTIIKRLISGGFCPRFPDAAPPQVRDSIRALGDGDTRPGYVPI